MSLRRYASSGVAWLGVASLLTASFGFIQLATMARLLSPEDFGLMAMSMVVLGFAHAFADMGISNAIVHRQDIGAEQLSSLYWVNVLTGCAVFAVVLIASPLIAAGFDEPRLTKLIAWAAIVFLITPTGQLFQVLLQKEFKFKELGIIEAAAAAAGMMVAIGCAVAGLGVYALVWGYLAEAMAKAILFLAHGMRSWRPTFRLQVKDLDGFISFGLYQMGERSISYFNSRIDQVLIGVLLGAPVLGYYNLATQLVMQPLWRINPVIMRVAFPVFSRLQTETASLMRGYLFILRALSLTNFPLLFGLAVVSPWLVPLCFGSDWLPAVVLIQILSIVALLRTVGNPIGAVLLAKGRADWGFRWNAALLLTQVLAIYLGAYLGGVIGVAWALLATQVIYSIANYRILVRGLLGPCLGDYLMTMVPALVLSLAMTAAVAVFMSLAVTPSVSALVAVIGLGGISYFTLCFVFQRPRFLEIWRFAWGES